MSILGYGSRLQKQTFLNSKREFCVVDPGRWTHSRGQRRPGNLHYLLRHTLFVLWLFCATLSKHLMRPGLLVHLYKFKARRTGYGTEFNRRNMDLDWSLHHMAAQPALDELQAPSASVFITRWL